MLAARLRHWLAAFRMHMDARQHPEEINSSRCPSKLLLLLLLLLPSTPLLLQAARGTSPASTASPPRWPSWRAACNPWRPSRASP